jgi:hypothetical protein
VSRYGKKERRRRRRRKRKNKRGSDTGSVNLLLFVKLKRDRREARGREEGE